VAALGRVDRNTVAWLCLVSVLAVHVLDEATTGFLPFYNNAIQSLRESLGFFPAPRFTFSSWLTGLIIAIVVGLVLAWLVARGGRFIRALTTAFAAFMLINALGHLLGSVYLGRILPGFWSSFLLLASALWMLRRGLLGDWRRRAGDTIC
jgi:hypothetical protein